jgi:three-Cys-motif partner protein
VNLEAYRGREQALIKHLVLERYLRKLAYKVAQFKKNTTTTLNYVDGFSGPWDYATTDLTDTSPSIAMRELGGVRASLKAKGVDFRVRCLFVEKDATAFAELQRLLGAHAEVEAVAVHGEFEQQIPGVDRFLSAGKNPFAFVFIDPTGWTGFGLQAITRVLRTEPGEVLINLMMKDIIRFIDDDASSSLPTFLDLFGDARYRTEWRGLTGLDREDASASAYCDRVRAAGGFKYCVSTVVLNPLADRTHYHLVYGTRSIHGLETFRDVERTALRSQRQVRAAAQQSVRQERDGQGELFGPEVSETSYAADLEERYQRQARERVRRVLREEGSRAPMPFDDVAASAMASPMTSLADVKGWLKAWKKDRQVEYKGLSSREIVPQVGRGHRVWWRGA